MDEEYLIAALCVALASESLSRYAQNGATQAIGAALGVVCVASLAAGFVDVSGRPFLLGWGFRLLPLVCLGAFPVAVCTVWRGARHPGVANRAVFALLAFPVLWILEASGINTVSASIEGLTAALLTMETAPTLSQAVYVTLFLIESAVWAAIPAILGVILVRDPRNSTVWWMGTGLISLAGILGVYSVMSLAG